MTGGPAKPRTRGMRFISGRQGPVPEEGAGGQA
jgi:hypothetical protein